MRSSGRCAEGWIGFWVLIPMFKNRRFLRPPLIIHLRSRLGTVFRNLESEAERACCHAGEESVGVGSGGE